MDITSFVSILIGGGILGFIQFLISRHDSKHDKNKAIVEHLEALDKKVDRIEASLDKRDAVLARTHILRFDDELCNGIKHSKEYFMQQLQDIDTYEKFCEKNPDFENSYAIEAVKHIREVYRKCRDENQFI